MIRRRVLALAIVVTLCMCGGAFLAACDDESDAESAAVDAIEKVDSDETWTICWYLCGSDLESESGAATADLEEMMESELSENVKVVIETGGANSWETSDVDPDKLQRFCYSTDGLELVDEQPLASMGKAKTFAQFLTFCKKNYPADHTAVILWNHGGGTVGGVAYDELYDYDSLTLDELHEGFTQAYDLSAEKPPIDIVGFDACLMASIDTADATRDVAHYMVASQESEPGGGWQYRDLLSGLSRNTSMGVDTFGKLICDTYLEDCERNWVEDEATLSMVDLSKAGDLVDAYDSAGVAALNYAYADEHFYTEFSRCADDSLNYGGNTFFSGYTDMVDLGSLIENSSELLPDASDAVLSALDECVAYQVTGPYREDASGLSCYHPYDADIDTCVEYAEVASSDAFSSFYAYGLSGELDASAASLIDDDGSGATGSPLGQASGSSLDEYPVYINDDGVAELNLGADLAYNLSTVLVHVAAYDEDADILLDLGTDNNMGGDWETGVFTENFNGTWGCLDGHLCYREVVYESSDYTLFSVPIKLNGKKCNLGVVYDHTVGEYKVIGARSELSGNFMADKNLRKLKEGDEVTTRLAGATLSGDDELEFFDNETFTVESECGFADEDMGDGKFALFFEMRDAQNDAYLSAPVYFTVEHGEIGAGV